MTDQKHIRRTSALVVALVLLLPTWSGEAHEIPSDVTVQAFIRPAGRTLTALVRVPLASMRDFNYPTRDPGYLEMVEATEMSRDAAQLWIAQYVEMLEGDVNLGFPDVEAVRIAVPGDRAFRSYETALENVLSAPLPPDVELPMGQAMLDVLLAPIEFSKNLGIWNKADHSAVLRCGFFATLLGFFASFGEAGLFEFAVAIADDLKFI